MPLPTLTELRTALAAAPENGLFATTVLPGYPAVNYNKGSQISGGRLQYQVFLYPSAGFGTGNICTVDDLSFLADATHDVQVPVDTLTGSFYSQSAGADFLYGPSTTPIPIGIDIVDITLNDFGPVDFAAHDDYWFTHGVTVIPSGYALDESPAFDGVRPRRSAWITPDPYSFRFDVTGAMPAGGGYQMPATPADAVGILETSVNDARGAFNRTASNPPTDTDWTTVVETPPFPGSFPGGSLVEGFSHGLTAGFIFDTTSDFLSATPIAWVLDEYETPAWAVFVALPERHPTSLPPGAVGYELESDGLTQPDRISGTSVELELGAVTTRSNPTQTAATVVTIFRWAASDLAGPTPDDVRAVVEPLTLLDGTIEAHHMPASVAATKTAAATVSIDGTTTGTLHVVIPVARADWNDAEFAFGAITDWALTHTLPPLPATPTPTAPTSHLAQLLSLASALITGVYQPQRYRVLYPHVAPPQRQFPRDDGLGISTRRSWPPPTSKQFGQRRGASATYE